MRGVGAPVDKYVDISVSDFPDQGEFGKWHPGRGLEICLTFFYNVGSVAHPDKEKRRALNTHIIAQLHLAGKFQVGEIFMIVFYRLYFLW